MLIMSKVTDRQQHFNITLHNDL